MVTHGNSLQIIFPCVEALTNTMRSSKRRDYIKIFCHDACSAANWVTWPVCTGKDKRIGWSDIVSNQLLVSVAKHAEHAEWHYALIQPRKATSFAPSSWLFLLCVALRLRFPDALAAVRDGASVCCQGDTKMFKPAEAWNQHEVLPNWALPPEQSVLWQQHHLVAWPCPPKWRLTSGGLDKRKVLNLIVLAPPDHHWIGLVWNIRSKKLTEEQTKR